MAKTQLILPPDACRAVVIGGSTGSIDVLLHLLPALQPPLSFAIVIVIHRRNTADSALATLFSAKTGITVTEVDDKDPILPGGVYLAPADYHLLIEQDETFSLDDSEKVGFSRPAIDVTFESAADVFGPALVGIVLSGANADGTVGLRAIKKAGGVTIAQQPDSAQIGFMPQQAILHAPVDQVLDIDGLIRFINRLNWPA